MTEKESIKNLKEIIDLSKEEIENNDENTTAILDITDLKSLAIVLKALEQKDNEISSLNQVHNYDVKMIDEVKGEAVKLYRMIDLMADFIDTIDTKGLHCAGLICDVATTVYPKEERKRICTNCIKSQFREKARE